MSGTLKTIAGVVAVLLVFSCIGLLFRFFAVINPGNRGIVVSWGTLSRVLGEGFHVLNPFTDEVITMNVQVQKYEVEAASASKDLQTVTSTIALNYRLDEARIQQLYQQIGVNYEPTIIRPAIEESVKASTALFTAEELVSKRSEVKEKIKQDLSVRLGKFYIHVDDLSIVNFSFSQEFNQAIELKQVAEQRAQQAENDLKRIQTEAQQQIERAKAEAESTRLQVEALKTGSEIIELRRTEAMLEMARKWDGGMPTTLIVGEGGALPLLNLGQ